MARPRTGYVEWQGDDATGRWRTRVHTSAGTRVWVNLPFELRAGDKVRAKRIALKVQIAAEIEGHAPAPASAPVEGGETVSAFVARWTADRRAAGLVNAALDALTIGRHLGELAERPLHAVTRRDLEQVVEQLDNQVRAGAMSWKTATNAWGLIRKVFNDAAASKRSSLRVLDASPARDVPGPDRGRKRQKQFLWPSEVLALVSSPAVPLAWRRVYALAVYLGARAGELAGLRARDVDRVRWVVSIAEAVVTRGSPSKATRRAPKTQAGTRTFTIEPALRPLLDALCAAAPTPETPLLRRFRTDGPDGASVYLQKHLRLAGLTRAELFDTTPTRKRMTFHDLRATYCTWSAIRGDEPLRIRQRAGHEDLETTMGYVRAAEVLDRAFVGEVFPELPPELVGGEGLDLDLDLSRGAPAKSSVIPGRYVASPAGFETAPAPAEADQAPQKPRNPGATPGVSGGSRGAAGGAGPNPGPNPEDSLRAAASAAIAAGDLDLAAEILALLKARGAHLRRVG